MSEKKLNEIITITVALSNLIQTVTNVDQIRVNEIYDDLEEWLNENG